MITRRELVPIKVTRNSIEWNRWRINYSEGIRELPQPVTDDLRIIELALVDHETIHPGDVFVPFDTDDCYPWEDPSLFCIKMRYSTWHFSGEEDTPVDTDNNKYDKVWQVL